MKAVERFFLWLWCMTPSLWLARLRGRRRGPHVKP